MEWLTSAAKMMWNLSHLIMHLSLLGRAEAGEFLAPHSPRREFRWSGCGDRRQLWEEQEAGCISSVSPAAPSPRSPEAAPRTEGHKGAEGEASLFGELHMVSSDCDNFCICVILMQQTQHTQTHIHTSLFGLYFPNTCSVRLHHNYMNLSKYFSIQFNCSKFIVSFLTDLYNCFNLFSLNLH